MAKWQMAQTAATASTGDDTCRAAKSSRLHEQASQHFEEFLLTLQRHWRKAKMAFEDIQTKPTDVPTGAYVAEEPHQRIVMRLKAWQDGAEDAIRLAHEARRPLAAN
eukprot:gene27999-34618_t